MGVRSSRHANERVLGIAAAKSTLAKNAEPFTDAEISIIVSSLEALAAAPLEYVPQLSSLLAASAHLSYKQWGDTTAAARRLGELMGGIDEVTFQRIFGHALTAGGWAPANAAVAKRQSTLRSTYKPWVVLVTGVNGIRKTSSMYMPWFKQALRTAVGAKHDVSDLPDGRDSFFRQLDYIIVTIANQELRQLYDVPDEADTAYIALKDAIFARYRTCAEIAGLMLVREAQARRMNVILESTGKDRAMHDYIDYCFDESRYRKLVVNFTIDDISCAQRAVRERMAKERADGRQALRDGGSAAELVRANAGGSQGPDALPGVQAASAKTWATVLEAGEGAPARTWLKAEIRLLGAADGKWKVQVGSDQAFTFGPPPSPPNHS